MDAFLHEGMGDDGTLLSEVELTISEARADLKSMQSEDGTGFSIWKRMQRFLLNLSFSITT